jgi:hypothetical protein
MRSSVAVRSAVSAATVAFANVALANEAAVEGQGEMHGIMPLLYLLGGVAALGVVVWLMVKFMGRNG